MMSSSLIPDFLALQTGVPLWMSGPFALLLLLIAVMPLSPHAVKAWWERRYAWVSVGLGALVSAWYLLIMDGGAGIVGTSLADYVSFMCLIGSLYVVAGGIHIRVRGEATPMDNVVFLLVGAVAANLIGTTGASMVLIRPYIRMNKIRISAYHVVFFIFIVSNCGGALTPVGDPPLFLGYLRGIPFFWLIGQVFPQWLFTIGSLLAVFYLVDRRGMSRAPRKIQSRIKEEDTWSFQGGLNVLLLGLIIASVFIPEHLHLREAVMLGCAAASWFLTPKHVHEGNHFSFGPIKEVAFLFAGIFLTMMPSLGYLKEHGRSLGFERPAQYYFASGSLSSVLDNAPTYLNFLQLAETTVQAEESAPAEEGGHVATRRLLEGPRSRLLVIAVSLGSVFFGAMTYIGNGPNFMVKSIADSMGVHTPDFFGYILKYSLPILLPILAAGAWLFL